MDAWAVQGGSGTLGAAAAFLDGLAERMAALGIGSKGLEVAAEGSPLVAPIISKSFLDGLPCIESPTAELEVLLCTPVAGMQRSLCWPELFLACGGVSSGQWARKYMSQGMSQCHAPRQAWHCNDVIHFLMTHFKALGLWWI